MRKLLASVTLFFLISLTSATCNKDDEIAQAGGSGSLTLTTNTGRIFTASVKNYSTPVYGAGVISQKNTLWFDSYKEPNGAYSATTISAIFDEPNKIYLGSIFKTSAPVLNHLYAGYPNPNNFLWTLDGREIFCNNPDIIFEQYSKPGRIKGRASGTELNGTLAYTVDFDFTVK